jgi:uncharacterized LabA/DUF88 family protein
MLPLAADPTQFVEVIKQEEKGSDVNLAVELLNDGWRGKFDCAVVVSNDADLVRSLKIVKQQLRRTVFVFTPGSPRRRKIVAGLKMWCHKAYDLLDDDLAACQFPDVVLEGTVFKPPRW